MARRKELEDLIDQLVAAQPTVIPTASSIPNQRDIARVLAPLLKCPSEKLKVELDDMWKIVSMSPRPENAALVPNPSSRRSQFAQIAWLQELALLTQAFAPHRQRIIPKEVNPSKCALLIADAQRAWINHIRRYGAETILDRCIAGLRRISTMPPPLLAFEGAYVVCDGQKLNIVLGSQERDFLRLLIQANGGSVPPQQFRRAGINHLKELKSRLLKKDKTDKLRDCIRSDRVGGYFLLQA